MSVIAFKNPEQPLKGDLILVDGHGLSHEDQTNALSLLTFDGNHRGEVLKADGRNYCVPLINPVSPYDTLQVSGGGNYDLGVSRNPGEVIVLSRGGKIVPPRIDSGLHTHSYQVVTNNDLLTINESSPKGSYPLRNALKKVSNTKMAFDMLRDSLIVPPRVAGYFTYDDIPDQYGTPQTAIIYQVPSEGIRTDGVITRYAQVILEANVDLTNNKVTESVDDIIAFLVFTCQLGGKALRELHDIGLAHQEPTIGNMLAIQINPGDNRLYLTDWETPELLKDFDEQGSALLRSKDLVVLFSSAVQMLDYLQKRGLLSDDTHRRCSTMLIVDTLISYGFKPDDFLGIQITPGSQSAVYEIASIPLHSLS